AQQRMAHQSLAHFSVRQVRQSTLPERFQAEQGYTLPTTDLEVLRFAFSLSHLEWISFLDAVLRQEIRHRPLTFLNATVPARLIKRGLSQDDVALLSGRDHCDRTII